MQIVNMIYGLMTYLTTSIETPVFKSLGDFSPSGHVAFEVRDYVPSVAAQTCNVETNEEFQTLAGYIGVMGAPENAEDKEIAMTAPVVDYNNDAGEKCMQFILPESEFGGDVSSAPAPTSENVQLISRPAMILAATTFNGWPSDADFEEKIADLKMALSAMEGDDTFEWSVKNPEHTEKYQYNEPWIPGPWRTNEVVVELEKKN